MIVPRNVTAAFSCVYSLTGSTIDTGGGAGAGSFGVNTGATCGYNATSNVPWITVISGGAAQAAAPSVIRSPPIPPHPHAQA